jgi:hypothetical protein
MKKILIEVSAGELLDKISILEIKLKKIKDKESLKFIKKEYEILNTEKHKNIDLGLDDESKKTINKHFTELKIINAKLWDIENEKRLCEKNFEFKDKFIQISRDIHFLNDKRAQSKLLINKAAGLGLREIKEYTKY